ncbi:glycerol dehydrogenase [Enterococcus sp.]|uniref:glycerol dehydrogenase n=1 Tax=Enterococcus sp. TaxID=35783 RepID=UPI0025BCB697|nr:glycerol dehydrogenase [Enterococcus sp.]
MEKIFVSPQRYIQGENLLKNGLHHIVSLGSKLLLLTDPFVWKIAGQELAEDLAHQGVLVSVNFSGESSQEEITRIVKEESAGIEAVVALGGGKVIDTGKAVAHLLKVAIAVVPSVASTDAPTSSISVLYSAEGKFEQYHFYPKNPELVLVDTALIVKAPAKLLTFGIADGLATYVEARAVAKSGAQNLVGGRPTLAALAIAEKCEAVLFANGLAAYQDNQQQQVTDAFDQVVEANTLLSGLGFESGGLAAAHAIHNGLTAITGTLHQLSHGEKIAYTTLMQLLLEEDTQELDRYITLYQALGLPTTLAEMRMATLSDQELLAIGVQATIPNETIHRMPFTITAEEVAKAFKAVDAYVTQNFSQRKKD